MSFLWFAMLYYVRVLAEEEKRAGREERKTRPGVCLSRASLLQRVFSKPIMRALCLQWAPPPTPNCFEPCEVALSIWFFLKSITRALCLQIGGEAPPPPPRNPETSCQIDPIWCSSVPGPRELSKLNLEASPIFSSRPELNNLNNLNPGEGSGGGFRGPGIT